MLTDVYLHGALGEKYGSHHRFALSRATEAARMMAANHKSFYQDFKDGWYNICIGDTEDGTYLTQETLKHRVIPGRAVHIIPVAAGAGKGTGKAIVGIAIMGLAIAFAPAIVGAMGPTMGMGTTAISLGGLGSITYGNIAAFGLAMAFTGVSQMLTPAPKVNSYEHRERPDQRASFLFNGPTNRSNEGAAIQLIYGLYEVGTIVGSAGITNEQLVT